MVFQVRTAARSAAAAAPAAPPSPPPPPPPPPPHAAASRSASADDARRSDRLVGFTKERGSSFMVNRSAHGGLTGGGKRPGRPASRWTVVKLYPGSKKRRRFQVTKCEVSPAVAP